MSALAGLALVPALSAPASAAAPVVVRVIGNQLVNGAGSPIRLLGVDRSGTEYACVQGWGIFDGPSDAGSVAAMAGWHIDAVRVPLNEDCWLGINGVAPSYSGANYQSAVESYVSELHAAGLVAVLDLHWNAPGTTSATGQQVMADADHSPAFWSSVASAFPDDPGVVFDLYNEPHDISWSCWRDGCTTASGWTAAGMQSLVDAVRSTGADQPVMVAGLGWANDLSSWLSYRPVDPAHQLVASAHVYDFSGCNTPACWRSTIGAVAAHVPVVTGELGESDCAHSFIDSYMSWADQANVSYLGWTWDTWNCSSGPALIASYDGTPTAFGVGLRDHLAALATAPGPAPSPGPAPPSGPVPSGYWLAGSDGAVFSYGQRTYFGGAKVAPAIRIVGMAATRDDAGYWLAGANGAVYPFGDAAHEGSAAGFELARPVVGMAATPDGAGYWLVAADGGIFTFGDASFFGSTGAMHLNAPIVGMAATPDGAGYWLVAADGGIFTFGDAVYRGSAAGGADAAPMSAMAT